MHMMFVDESGDPGYPPDGKWHRWGGTKLFVRIGAIIHGWKWKAWNQQLLQFKYNRGLTWDAEIKAADIRRGKGAFVGWDENQRQQFLLDLTTLVGSNVDITLLAVVIDKAKVDVTKTDRMVKPEIRSLELLLERYNMFLNHQQDKAGIVILDPVKEASDDNLRRFQSYLSSKSPHLKPLHIVESTFFAKSHTSNMIQIADVCTNVFYRRTVRGHDDAQSRPLTARFWKHNNRVQGYGIKKWPL